MLELTEEDALQRLRAQDPAALSWLIGRYNRYVASIVCAVLGARCRVQDAEELTADVFYSVFRRAEAISPGKLQAYLARRQETARRIFCANRRPLRQISIPSRCRTAQMPRSRSFCDASGRRASGRQSRQCPRSTGKSSFAIIITYSPRRKLRRQWG